MQSTDGKKWTVGQFRKPSPNRKLLLQKGSGGGDSGKVTQKTTAVSSVSAVCAPGGATTRTIAAPGKDEIGVRTQTRWNLPPFPAVPPHPPNKQGEQLPLAPVLTTSSRDGRVWLQWDEKKTLRNKMATVTAYELFVCGETDAKSLESQWTMLGCVKASKLPMRVTMTDFKKNANYHFGVRAVDRHERRAPMAVAHVFVG